MTRARRRSGSGAPGGDGHRRDPALSRNGIVGAVLLGFGRGLGRDHDRRAGPVLGQQVDAGHHGSERARLSGQQIARTFTDGSNIEKSALVLAGLVLFVITLVVNLVARMIVGRSEVGVR